MREPSKRERRYWGSAAAALALIWASAYFVQFALDWLRERNLLRLSIGAAFAATCVVVLGWLRRRGAGALAWAALAAVAGVYALVAWRLPIVQERIHLLEYGVVALLFRAALGERSARDPRRGSFGVAVAPLGAFVLTTLGGALDEGVQGILPNRVGEWRDAGLNALSAALALGAHAALEQALASGGQGRGARP